MKKLILISILIPVFGFSKSIAIATINLPDSSIERSFQFATLPALYYNSIALAYGLKKQKFENTFEINCFYVPVGFERFTIGMHYNLNYYLKNNKTFIPFWTGINRVNLNNNFEDSGPFYNRMNIRIGSGFGKNINIKNKNKIRVELGIGAAIHMENLINYDNLSAFPFKLELNKFTVSKTNPIIPSFRIKIRYLLVI